MVAIEPRILQRSHTNWRNFGEDIKRLISVKFHPNWPTVHRGEDVNMLEARQNSITITHLEQCVFRLAKNSITHLEQFVFRWAKNNVWKGEIAPEMFQLCIKIIPQSFKILHFFWIFSKTTSFGLTDLNDSLDLSTLKIRSLPLIQGWKYYGKKSNCSFLAIFLHSLITFDTFPSHNIWKHCCKRRNYMYMYFICTEQFLTMYSTLYQSY